MKYIPLPNYYPDWTIYCYRIKAIKNWFTEYDIEYAELKFMGNELIAGYIIAEEDAVAYRLKFG